MRRLIVVAAILAIIMSPAFPQNFEWATSIGGDLDEEWPSLAADTHGNLYVTGTFSSPTLHLGTIVLTNKGNRDIFIAKLDSTGSVVWARSMGGELWEWSSSICVDEQMNVYVTGFSISPAISLGQVVLTGHGNHDVFVVKLDPSGAVVWARCYGGEDFDAAMSLAVDQHENVYVAGYFLSPIMMFDTLTIRSGGPAPNSGISNLFLAKLDGNGQTVWVRTGDPGANATATSVTLDDKGAPIVVGTLYSDSLTIGGRRVMKRGLWDALAISLTSDGDVLRASSHGGGQVSCWWSVRDAFGNVYAPERDPTQPRNVLAKYDPGGSLVWVKDVAQAGIVGFLALATDGEGNLYMVGDRDASTTVFMGDTLRGYGGVDIVIAKADSSGTVTWARSLGGDGNDTGWAWTFDGYGRAYISGTYSSTTLVSGNATLATAGGADVFVARLNLSKGITPRFAEDSVRAGTIHAIGWDPNFVRRINVDYTTNNGTTWTPVAQNLPAATERLEWLAPVVAPPSSACMIRYSSTTADVPPATGRPFTMYAQVNPPVASVPSGTYPWAQSVTLQVSPGDASLRYTLDGSIPDENATLFCDSLRIDSTCVLSVRGFKSGWLPSIVSITAYTIESGPTGANDETRKLPGGYFLAQNSPNPFNPVTTIRFGLPVRSAITLTLYNCLGQCVAVPVDGEYDAGYHEVHIDGSMLSTGVYLYRLQAGSFTETKRLILMK